MRTRLNKRDYFADLYSSIQDRLGDQAAVPTFAEWALTTTLDGHPFSFERHEYLRGVYEDDALDITCLKAAQMGLTSWAILKVLYRARFCRYKGILYLFPSRTDVTEFSKGRVDPLIEDNETVKAWIRNTDAANVKQVWNCILYLRGMKSKLGLKSVPVDMVVVDEGDEAEQNAIDVAKERMSHSLHKEILKLSNPTLPDYGIDRFFKETDQRYWLLKCPSCGEWTCLEDTFPDCLLEIDGRVIRACLKCRGELNPSVGGWVPKHPSVTDKHGYHFSQLFSHYVEPADILHQYRTTNNLTDFMNLKIGNAFVEAENRLGIQEVLALCGNEGIASEDRGPCFMGVDQGKFLHVVIGRRHIGRAGQVVHVGIYKDFEELDRLMKVFNVSRAVVDALPETRNARAFAERHRGRVFLSYYSERQRGDYAWNEKDLTVSSNRTESLDASHNELLTGRVVLPRECDVVREFAVHCNAMAKKLEEDEGGSKRYIYVRLGQDHFRHAFNYESMARRYGAGSFFSDCDLI